MKSYYIIVISIIVLGLFSWYFLRSTIRPMAVSGVFYESNPLKLQGIINSYLQTSPQKRIEGKIRMILVPHAGYVYSGKTAAQVYKLLENQEIKRVILIGNSHHHFFSGAVIDNHDYWETPLGRVKVDKKFAGKLLGDKVKFNSQAHQDEHSLEIEIPFLQTVIDNKFSIVPILFGNQGGEEILLAKLKDNLSDTDLIVISTDLSHYLSLLEAEQKDNNTIAKLLEGKIPEGENNYCALDAVPLGLKLATMNHWMSNLIAQSNSSVASGDTNRVVGYASIAWTEKNFLNREEQLTLLNIAKQTVETYVSKGEKIEVKVKEKRLNKVQGVFVTLHKQGNLRGCIGNIVGEEPLVLGVRDMAIAATRDSRFNPVQKEELNDLDYEISVLSPLKKIKDWHNINLEQEGVIVQQGNRSGVFLPQVATETGWNLETFLSHLCLDKAGLSQNCYQDKNTDIYTFTAQVFTY